MSPRPRQAVVIIHGIGEQRSMETLRGFVRGWRTGENNAESALGAQALESQALERRTHD
jgi:hypothetical protein